MFSHIHVEEKLPQSLYRDTTIWIQVFYAAFFFTTSSIWIVAIPRHIKFNLDRSEFAIGIVAVFFSVAVISSRPITNKLGALFNRHQLMAIGLVLMMVGSLLSMVNDSIVMVTIARSIIGISDGTFYVGVSTLIVANATKDRQGRAMNLYTMGLYIGITLGPLIGEQLYHFSEENVITNTGIVSAIFVVIMFILLRFIPSRYSPEQEAGKKRAAFCYPALFPGVIFVFGICVWAGFEGFAPILGKGAGVSNVAGLFATVGLSVMLLRLINSTFIDRMPIKLSMTIALGNSLIAAIMFSRATTPTGLYVGAFFIAASLGFFYPAFVLAALRRGVRYDSGTVLGTLAMSFDLAFGILPPLLGYIVTRSGYSDMFVWAAVSVGIAFMCMLFLRVPKNAISRDTDSVGDVVV